MKSYSAHCLTPRGSGNSVSETQRSMIPSDADVGRLKAMLITDRRTLRDECTRVSLAIHDLAETAGLEYGSRDCLAEAASLLSCQVSKGLGPYETGMSATFGEGRLHVALMAEYDALPGIGHACGHNLVSGSSLAAFMLLRRVADQLDIKVTLFGTPCEEAGAAKVELLETGVFDGVDFALMAHPAPFGADAPFMGALARYRVIIQSGTTGHSAAYGEGVTASETRHLLEASLAVMNRRLPPGATVDWETLTTSGSAAVHAGRVEMDVILRVRQDDELLGTGEILAETCEAVATITNTTVGCSLAQRPMPAMRQDSELTRLWRGNRSLLGMMNHSVPFPASTDLGALSHKIPCLHPYFDIESWPAKNHDPEFTAAAVSPAAHAAMINAGTVMAMTVVDAATNWGAIIPAQSLPGSNSRKRC